MPIFDRFRNDADAPAAPTNPGTPGIPLPPFGGDRWAWIRWGVNVVLLLILLWLGVPLAGKVNEQSRKIDEQSQEIKALKSEVLSRPINVTGQK